MYYIFLTTLFFSRKNEKNKIDTHLGKLSDNVGLVTCMEFAGKAR